MEQRKDIPAFPNSNGNTPGLEAYSGMTLRDFFAANAMQGMLAAPIGEFTHTTYEEAAEDAYTIADDMLTQREK